MLIYGADRELKLWAGERLGIPDFGPSRAIGVARKGQILAVAVFNNYHPPSIQITFVTTTPRWASRVAIRGILGYVFLQLKCKRLSAVTDATNQPARAFLCRLGFHQEGYHPEALPSGDAVTYGMLLKDALPWLAEGSNVQRFAADPKRAKSARYDQGADGFQHSDGGREPQQHSDSGRVVEVVPGARREMDANIEP